MYIAVEALPITNWVELIDKTEFAKTILDKDSKSFVGYVAILKAETSIYLSQIVKIAAL